MTTTNLQLAEETVDPAEARINADFVAFLKAVSARRYPTGPIRRFNQGTGRGLRARAVHRPRHRCAGAPGRPLRRAAHLRRVDPLRQRHIAIGPREGCARNVRAGIRRGRTEPHARRVAAGFRAEQPSGDGRGEYEGFSGVVESDGRRRPASSELLPVAPAIGGHRIPGATTANQSSGYTVLEHDALPVRSWPRREVHRAPVRDAAQRRSRRPLRIHI